MVQSICGRKAAEKNRNKAGVTISDGYDGILYISADSENIVTIDATVTGEEKRLVRRWRDLEYVEAGDIGCGRIAEQTEWNIWSCETNIASVGCGRKPPAGRKTCLQVCTFVGEADRSAFMYF